MIKFVSNTLNNTSNSVKNRESVIGLLFYLLSNKIHIKVYMINTNIFKYLVLKKSNMYILKFKTIHYTQ